MFIAKIVIYFTVFSCLGRAAFQSVVKSTEKPDVKYFHSPYILLCVLGYTIFSCCIFINVLCKQKFEFMLYKN